MTLDDIKIAIRNLPPADLATLRTWLETVAPAQDTAAETAATKFGRLAGRALADIRKRVRE